MTKKKHYRTFSLRSVRKEVLFCAVLVVIAVCAVAFTHMNAGAGSGDPFPSFMLADPEDVVRDGVAAIDSRASGSRISGLLNALLVWSGRILPRRWLVSIMGQFAPKTLPPAVQ